jgi:hypothetical protein
MSQELDCIDLNLSEGLTARFQSLPSIQISDFRNLQEIVGNLEKYQTSFV